MKKSYFLVVLILLLNNYFFAQSEISISVTGQIVNTQFKEIELIQILPNGAFQNILKSPLKSDGSFALKGKLNSADYYHVKLNNQLIPLILRNNSEIKIYGDGNKLDKFCNIINSDESQQLMEFQRAENTWNKILDSANNELKKNPSKQQELSNAITPRYMDFQQFKQNYVQMNQNSAALYPMIKMFDPEKDFENYQLVVAQVINAFSESSLVKIEQEKYLKFKKKMIDDNPLAKGKVAPDFEELKTDGKSKMKLSDLKGNVVLIDFWASWCGPCRAENPKVVKTYAKYKDSGFTVMSVSLDSDKAKWLDAIQKDGLVWPNHVSDLGGWQSKVARIYGVGSIPLTILIDKEGKIIATNLRGQSLEAELQKIFLNESNVVANGTKNVISRDTQGDNNLDNNLKDEKNNTSKGGYCMKSFSANYVSSVSSVLNSDMIKLINYEFIKLENFFNIDLGLTYSEAGPYYDLNSKTIHTGNSYIKSDLAIRQNGKYINEVYKGVLAHEFAHALQHNNGMFEYWKEGKQPELHADFIAGFYIGKNGIISKDKLTSFAKEFFDLGDTETFDADHHGTPSERRCAFLEGYKVAVEYDFNIFQAYNVGIDYIKLLYPCDAFAIIREYSKTEYNNTNYTLPTGGYVFSSTEETMVFCNLYKQPLGEASPGKDLKFNNLTPGSYVVIPAKKLRSGKLRYYSPYTFNVYKDHSGQLTINKVGTFIIRSFSIRG